MKSSFPVWKLQSVIKVDNDFNSVLKLIRDMGIIKRIIMGHYAI